MICKDLKISEMPKADHLHGHDLIPIVQHGKNKVIDIQDLVDLFKRILPPPPHPCPGPHPYDPCPGPHDPCPGPHFDPFYTELDFGLLNKVREDAAIAKASASSVEGKLDVLQKTADVSLDSSQKALNLVKMLKAQLGQIKQLVIEQEYLKAEVRNSKSKINYLKNAVLILAERVKQLEINAGLEFENIDLGGDSWLDEIQDPLDEPNYHHHHHHHHHSAEEDDDTTNNSS
jgi:hypothetical protein